LNNAQFGPLSSIGGKRALPLDPCLSASYGFERIVDQCYFTNQQLYDFCIRYTG